MFVSVRPPSISSPFSPVLHQSSRFLIPHQVRVNVGAVCRGDLSFSLESPSGTVSLLLDTRPNDTSTAGLQNWTLMTVHCWGEQPQGLWTLQVTVKLPSTALICYY